MSFHVGDVVRIRQWDDMASEFGATSHCILCRGFAFASEMKPLCGMEFTISDIMYVDTQVIVELNDPKVAGYIITTDMIEPVECDSDSEIVETEEFADFLEQYM